MTGVSLEDMSTVARELRDALDDIDDLSRQLGGTKANLGAEGRWRRARLAAHAASTVMHGRKWTADQHNTQADMASFAEWAEWNALTVALKAARERAHSLRQVLSTLQTVARVEADLSR